jgi:hypothetical protein
MAQESSLALPLKDPTDLTQLELHKSTAGRNHFNPSSKVAVWPPKTYFEPYFFETL